MCHMLTRMDHGQTFTLIRLVLDRQRTVLQVFLVFLKAVTLRYRFFEVSTLLSWILSTIMTDTDNVLN